ncbi:MAG: hypothetical protein ACP5OR_09295 [Candidatus Dormibacteria bacterium]
MAQSAQRRTLIVGGGRAPNFPVHSLHDITVNPDPAAAADITGTLEDVHAPYGSFTDILFERVPWRALCDQNSYGARCMSLLAPGGTLTIQTGMNAPILDLAQALRLPCPSTILVDTTGPTLQLEQHLCDTPNSPAFSGSVTSRHRLFLDDPKWSMTDASMHNEFTSALASLHLHSCLTQSIHRFIAAACSSLCLPDAPEVLTKTVLGLCCTMGHRADLTVGMIMELQLQSSYAAFLGANPISHARIPLQVAADAHCGTFPMDLEIMLPRRTVRILQELSEKLRTTPDTVLNAACEMHCPSQSQQFQPPPHRNDTAGSRDAILVPLYLLSTIARNAAQERVSTGTYVANAVDVFAATCILEPTQQSPRGPHHSSPRELPLLHDAHPTPSQPGCCLS